MLAQLLSTLFGSRTPSSQARAAQSNWNDWLQPVNGDVPTGTDPSYDDDFLAIKEEVAKLSDIDDARIIDTAERLLKHTAKDARVAVYYVYGRMRRDGAEGVAEGFELLSALIDRFGDRLLPARAETRKVALEWLAGSTFANRLDRVQGLSGALLERTLSALALITERTTQWPPAAQPQLGPLFSRFEGRVEVPLPADHYGSGASTGAVSSGLPSAIDVSSSSELLDRARHLAQFLRDQPQGYLAAYRLLRCVRWDTLSEVPPQEASGKTRLAPPRAELRAQLKRLLLQKQWPELLDRIERAFAEGANHFWLDLQYYAFIAQEQAGGEYAQAREQVATDCALMLERLPGLEQLAFSDGTPFADDATLEWIARHVSARGQAHGNAKMPMMVASAHTNWMDVQTQASVLAVEQGLDAAFDWLQRLPAQEGERDRFARQLVMAHVAECVDRLDTALHLLTTLDATAQRFDLAEWEPALAFEAKHHLWRLLKIRLSRKGADKPALAQRMDTLLGELTALDPARAVALT